MSDTPVTAPLSTSELDAQRKALFQRNVAAFKEWEYYSEISLYMDLMREPVMRIVGSSETADLNIDLGHTLFYAKDADAFAREQLDQHWRRGDRFYLDPPTSPPPSGHHSFVLAEQLHQHLRDNAITDIAPDATADAGYLLIYGIGLGLHLPELFERAEVRYFIVIEEFPEFLYHSMYLIDWQVILDRLRERGQTLQFYFGTEPRAVHTRIHWYMRGEGFGLLDGSFTYRHYRSLLLDGVYDQFVKELPLLPVSDGFFEDEMVMLNNCGRNLTRYEHYLLEVQPRLHKDVPIFIVGSGPSFDKTVDVVRRFRDQAIVISCGTGISAMLKHGLRPDFHCELENVPGSFSALQIVQERFGSLKDITLIASSTVWPEMAALFRRVIYFHRDSVSSSKMWSVDGQGLFGMAPTVTNLALRASLLMAFRRIYLFGVDMGTRNADVAHSSSSLYNTDPAWMENKHDPVRAMTIPMPANFGGEAFTNTILHWARMMMIQSLVPFPDARIYNCSDGVRIDGTIPKLAHTVALDTAKERRDNVLERIFTELKFQAAGEAVEPRRLHDLQIRAQAWTDEFLALIARAKSEHMGFVPFYEAAMPLLALKGPAPFQEVLHSVYIGTLMMCFQTGYFFYRRVGEARKLGLMDAFLDALHQRMEAMRGEFDALLQGLRAFQDARSSEERQAS
ncbi:MAG TPA: 6-hydroxymethylpterin diphosphokinase MptE-like protein [Stellaceae bacterium]|nr:6-hydroxymethylpterin diphosphokinase MptE-like protein [Stellaceae bacterium]